MIRYVCGFMFSPDKEDVAVILKSRGPKSLHGKYNGIGGKIEQNEGISEAMIREFREETGVSTRADMWADKIDYRGKDFTVYFFLACSNLVYKVKTKESERVLVVPVSYLMSQAPIVPNLRWIVPLILDPNIAATTISVDRRPTL